MTLFVFALNTPVSVTVSDLTRARGETPDLPPLAEWLGLEALDTDRIEMFPVGDLGEMHLTDYLATAHDAQREGLSGVSARLNALDGSVLIVPQDAMTGASRAAAEATLIAELPVIAADHAARLAPRPPHKPQAPSAPAQTRAPQTRMGAMPWVTGGALILAAALVWMIR